MTPGSTPYRAGAAAAGARPDVAERSGARDRILALDTMVVNAIGLIVLIGIAQGTQTYFEASMIIAMLGFVSTVAYARFVLRGDIIE